MNKDEIKNKISMALKDPILQQGFELICKENAELKKANEKNAGWHDLRKNPQDLPKDIKLNEFESYNPLVIIFFYRYDDYGKSAKVYALDRWSGEPFNEWEMFNKDDVIAWHELPKFEK